MKPANYAHTLCTWNLTHMTKIGNYMKDFKLVNDSHIKLNYYLVYWFWKKNWTINDREGNGTPLQYSCLENPMDRGAWKAAVHGVAEGWTWLSDFTFTFHFHALEKETATHSSVLAWKIPGMGEPGGLPSMGLHRVEHDWSDLAAAAAAAAAARSLYHCMFNCLRTCQTAFQCGCGVSHAHQWYGSPISPHLHQHLMPSLNLW